MKKCAAVITMIAGAAIALAQPPAQAPPTQTPPVAGRGQGGGRGAQPAVPSISKRPPAGLGTIRLGAADRLWFGWQVGIPSAAFKQVTLSEVLVHADTILVTGVEASSTQMVSPEVPKMLDYRLRTGERAALNYRLRELNQHIWAYRVDNVPTGRDTLRAMFEFAKAINAGMIVVPEQAPLADLDELADEFEINVAVESRTDPKSAMAAIGGLGKRMGVAANLGGWMHDGIKPVDGLAVVRERLMAVSVIDRSALGPKGHDVTLGSGVAGLPDFFLAVFQAGVKPLYISVDATGAPGTYADLLKSFGGFERAMWPAMAARVRQVVDSPAGKIRGPERLSAELKAQIDAAAPREAIVKPRKPRKLLVTDLQMYGGPHPLAQGNLMLALMGKYTGAFEPTFSNDLELLKYPKIKEFDGIWLNDVCGMVHNDPEVRDGILRFVREGGGIGGHHAVTFSDNNWPEFAEMMGGWSGQHHVEQQTIKIDDPNSPLTRMFGTASFEHVDEFYQFPAYSPYSREKQHVLLSIDVEKSDRATGGRFCEICTRPDQDYGLAWIKTYGKGRTYFTPLGHTDVFYTDKRWTGHILAAVQYILGDLDADATPSAKLSKK
jgi:type 1 glutamine amidotransferase